MKVGMRNIKTALSVFICVLIFNLFSESSPFYASIAAIITMQSSVVDSFTTGRNRILGTFIGALVGLILALIQPGNPFLCGIGIVIVIYICNILDWNKAISIAGIVFMAIMVNMGDRSPFEYSLNRIIETFVGITIALLINYFVAPPNISNIIKEKSKWIFSELSKLVKDSLCNNKKVDLSHVKNEINSLQDYFELYNTELKLKPNSSKNLNTTKETLEIFNNLYHNMKTIGDLNGSLVLNEENLLKLRKVFKHDCPEYSYEKNDVNTVFNYHVGKILEDMLLLRSILQDNNC